MTVFIDTMIERATFAVSVMDATGLRAYQIFSEPLPRHYAGDALEDAKRQLWEALNYRSDPEGAEEMAIEAATAAHEKALTEVLR